MIPSGGVIGAAGVSAVAEPQWSNWLVAAANSNIDRSGGQAWASPANAYTDNGSYATATSTDSKPTNWIYLRSFASKPSVTTILGIEVKVRGKVNFANSNGVMQVELWNGSQIGNVARTAPFEQTTDADVTVGGESDLFGATSISAADFAASAFGVRLSFDVTYGGNYTYSIDSMQFRVRYQ